ncbi:MAG: M20/M25/M40 family metallo-hydrolase, partial [Sedimentisphaerales bacterium]|nr:M20/M25/M40 family metallo-hydrolase [Sedimentisphaerales bacterium]
MALQDQVLRITEDILQNPTAPFREEAVRNHIRSFCQDRGIAARRDRMGNVVAEYGDRRRPCLLAFAAHMDHPGFIIAKDSVRNRTHALFYGGVEESYFRGERVKVFTAAGPVRARVVRTKFNLKRQIKRVELKTEGPVCRGDVAMWDLPPFKVSGGKIHTRSCDDVVGCGAILAWLNELARRRIPCRVKAVFTVAEEGGCHGAKYLALKKRLDQDVPIITLETSSERPNALIGEGMVIRVGDNRSVFHDGLTEFLVQTARTIARRDESFKFQRRLMDGGRCESSIYQTFGLPTAALCVPLGNYHNRDKKRKKIAAEVVSVADLTSMVQLMIAAVQ